MKKIRYSKIAVFLTLTLLGWTFGCQDERGPDGRGDITSSTGAIHESEQGIVDKLLAPIRKLVVPNNVYMKTIEETFQETGTLRHTVHVYNPTGGGVNFELAAETGIGDIDWSHTFTEVEATPIIDGVQGSPVPFPDGAGKTIYSLSNVEIGWYRFHFHYEALNPGRTLVMRAYDNGGAPLKISWDDPQGADIQIRTTLQVETATPVFFKGGVFRNPLPNMFAYVDNVKVNGNLLYRRAFDQGQFNFPLGILSAGEHILEFSISKSSKLGKNWFGVNETSFDLLGTKTEWDDAQFVYDGEMRTADYDAWNEGVAFAQGETLVQGVRPPPVRRGTTFTMTLRHPALGGPWRNAALHIYPFGGGSETGWTAVRPSGQDYTGGIYTASGFETRSREHWRVTVPEDAPVGRYVVRAIAPWGMQVGEDVLFYVIHNPFPLLFDRHIVSQAEIDVYGYDEDWDGVTMEGEYEMDLDGDPGRDHFAAEYQPYGPIDGAYTLHTYFTGASRRIGAETDFSMLDYAVASAEGTATEFDTMRRLYRLVSQRYNYGGGGSSSGDLISGFMSDPEIFSPDDAVTYSKPGLEMPMRLSLICYGTAAVMASIPRAIGILTRIVTSRGDLAGWGDHGFIEAFIPTLPRHGGNTGPETSSPVSDTDHWYVFDATNPQGGFPDPIWHISSEAIAPRSQFGKSAWVLVGDDQYDIGATTNTLSWDFLLPEGVPTTTDVLDVTEAYESGPEFWLTKSGATGWIGVGDKDVYRISKSATGASAVRITTLPNDGEYLVPKICIGQVDNDPVMPERCVDADTRFELPDGESYVVVFNDAGNAPSLWGDSVQYELTLDYDADPCNEATAVDMGPPGTTVDIVNNGCLKVTQYPDWWGTRQLQLQSMTPGTYPTPFDWSNCAGTSGSDTIIGDWQSFFINDISDACTTIFKLKGEGNGNVTIRYYAM